MSPIDVPNIPVAVRVVEDPVEHVHCVDDRRGIEWPAAHYAQRVGQLSFVVVSPLFRILFQADLQSDSGYRIFGVLWKNGGQNGLIITGTVEQLAPRLVTLKC